VDELECSDAFIRPFYPKVIVHIMVSPICQCNWQEVKEYERADYYCECRSTSLCQHEIRQQEVNLVHNSADAPVHNVEQTLNYLLSYLLRPVNATELLTYFAQ
jgi:hypothetical protein